MHPCLDKKTNNLSMNITNDLCERVSCLGILQSYNCNLIFNNNTVDIIFNDTNGQVIYKALCFIEDRFDSIIKNNQIKNLTFKRCSGDKFIVPFKVICVCFENCELSAYEIRFVTRRIFEYKVISTINTYDDIIKNISYISMFNIKKLTLIIDAPIVLTRLLPCDNVKSIQISGILDLSLCIDIEKVLQETFPSCSSKTIDITYTDII